jgi:cyclic-di-GMP-binding protein
MPSFDIVSKLDFNEVDNAVMQTTKEVIQRFDFKGSNTTVEREEKKITIDSADDYKVKATVDVLQTKLVKRGVSLKCLKLGKIEPAAGGRVRQVIDLQDGIDVDRGREIIKEIKDAKLKVQSSFQGDAVRVSGKKRDDLQEAIALVRAKDYPIPLQFINYRD